MVVPLNWASSMATASSSRRWSEQRRSAWALSLSGQWRILLRGSTALTTS